MELGMWYWLFLVAGLVWAGFAGWPITWRSGPLLLVFLLLGMLGYQVFGAAVK